MKNGILIHILFTILLNLNTGTAQVSLSTCDLSIEDFVTIQNQTLLYASPVPQGAPTFMFLKFTNWPDQNKKVALEQLGVKLIQPESNKTFLVSVPQSINLQDLKGQGAHQYQISKSSHKLNCALWDSFLSNNDDKIVKLNVYPNQSTNLLTVIADLWRELPSMMWLNYHLYNMRNLILGH